MAVFFSGMTDREVSALTERMTQSGENVDLSSIPGVKVDKHSTGGVGDKTSLIAAPLAAAAGVIVPMISGRALGHTGGTLDKLESIPGLPHQSYAGRISRATGRSMGSRSSGRLRRWRRPTADFYALRDATATVESIPLIASFDHVEEAGDRSGRAGAGRQGRRRRIHEAAGGRAPPGADDGRASDGARTSTCRR